MSFKYIDPGFGISNYNGIYTEWGFSPPLLNVENYTYNRNFGVAFYTDQKSYYEGVSTIQFGSRNINEFYMKFDEYFPESANFATTTVQNGDSEILSMSQDGANLTIRAMNDVALVLSGDETHLKAGRVNTIWLHVETTEQTGWITLVINGEYVFREQEGWGYTGPASSAFSFNINESLPVSNLIISDEEIALNETIVEISNSAVETTMLENDGIYSSAGAGDYVLQSLDPSSLYNQFKSDTKVSAMLAVAIPAYTTGDGVKRLTCRIVDGENVTDYETTRYLPEMTEEEFASLEGAMPLMAKQIPIASDTTFAKIDGLKVGWVTGV